MITEKEAKVYQTSDGKMFFDRQEAQDVEVRIAMKKFVASCWDLGHDATQDEVGEWLAENVSVLKTYLTEYPS